MNSENDVPALREGNGKTIKDMTILRKNVVLPVSGKSDGRSPSCKYCIRRALPAVLAETANAQKLLT